MYYGGSEGRKTINDKLKLLLPIEVRTLKVRSFSLMVKFSNSNKQTRMKFVNLMLKAQDTYY